MIKKRPLSGRPHFTKISDKDLTVGLKYQGILDPLLYFKVLRTKDLLERSSYKHGIKSFRKLLKKFERHGVIGMIAEDQFSEQFIYPKESSIRKILGDEWKKYFVHDESLENIKLHWQVARIAQILGRFKECSDSKSYINSEGHYYDFQIIMDSETRVFYDLYSDPVLNFT